MTRLAWYVISLSLYLLSILLLVRTYPDRATPLRITWTIGLAGFWNTLDLGQVYMPLALASTGAWLLLQRGRPLVAGLLIGFIIAMKPNFVVWPLLLMVAGYWVVAASACAFAALLSLAPAIVYGPQVYARWLEALPLTGQVGAPTNASLPSMLDRLDLTFLGIPLTLALLFALGTWIWQRRPDVVRINEFGLLASLLSSPIAWSGYTVLLLPIFFRRKWTWLLGLAAALLLFPAGWSWTLSEWSPWHRVTFGSVFSWALLLVLFTLVEEAWGERKGGIGTKPAP